MSSPQFITDLKVLADAGLEMDTANPTPALMASIVKLTDKIPTLRIVVDHLLQPDPPTDPAARKAYQGTLRELGKRPHTYAKISEVLRRVDGRVSEDLNFYRERLDELWEYFGQDRLMYGSDWPNSDIWAEYPKALRVAQEYVAAKGPGVAEKIFWKNSIAAYRWVHREANQPKLA
jgi:predicted TIM-barrel fold metal-dependent hydrolase